jgi:hypothetical protein
MSLHNVHYSQASYVVGALILLAGKTYFVNATSESENVKN